jgi:hypothetical protein
MSATSRSGTATRRPGSIPILTDLSVSQDLGVDGDAAEAKWHAMKANGWFNEGTSWVRASFVAYNPNFGSYVAVVYKTDFEPTGEISMKMEISVMLASQYTTVRNPPSTTLPQWARSVLFLVLCMLSQV